MEVLSLRWQGICYETELEGLYPESHHASGGSPHIAHLRCVVLATAAEASIDLDGIGNSPSQEPTFPKRARMRGPANFLLFAIGISAGMGVEFRWS
jgi:hypothetical protein